MRSRFDHFVQKIRRHTTLLTMLTLTIVVLSIPLTIVVLQQEQDIRQEAAIQMEQPQIASNLSVQSWITPPKNAAIPGRLIVRYKPTIQASSVSTSAVDERIRRKFRASIKKNEKLRVQVVQVKPDEEQQVITDLSQDPSVEFVSQSYYLYIASDPNDPDFDQQWGLSKTQFPAAWNKTEGSSNIVIAILDTGIDESHPDLKEKILTSKSTNLVKVANGKETVQDKNGHGTNVAGIAAAVTNNDIGIAGGCPECKLMNVKIAPDSGTDIEDTDVAEGIRYAVDNGANILNLSISGPNEMKVINEAIDYATSKGVLVIVAAGNSGSSTPMYPAGYEKAMAVGATDESNKRASFSNYGAWVDIAAPGANIFSTMPTYAYEKQKNNSSLKTSYGRLEGTSQASPLVAGAVGLLMSQGMNAEQAKNKLYSTAENTVSGTSNGLINPPQAVGAQAAEPDESDENDETEEDENSDDNKRNKNNKTDKNAKDDTADPCITPKANSGKSGNKQETKADKGEKSGSLYERVLRNSQDLRAKFFGGGTTSSRSKQNNNNKQEKKASQSTNKNKNSKKADGTSVQAKDPCEPASDSPDSGTPDQSRRNTRRAPRNTRNAQPPSDSRQTDGNERVVQEPGENVVVTVHERTCEPATVRTPGGVTTIPCDSETQSLSVIEYNTIVDCYSDIAPPKNCTPEKKEQADLNKDGRVNQLDLQIFLTEFKTQ